jgi:hypothetical protein
MSESVELRSTSEDASSAVVLEHNLPDQLATSMTSVRWTQDFASIPVIINV